MAFFEAYWSPTGGTKQVADLLSIEWKDEKESLDLMTLLTENDSLLKEDDICMFAVPSFGGRVPEYALNKIKTFKGNNTKAIVVVSYGNRAYDDTLLELKDTLTDNGFVVIAGVAAIAQHSIAPLYGKGRPDIDDIDELKDFSKKLKAKINGGKCDEVKVPGNKPYVKYSGVPIHPIGGLKCQQCGFCAQRCPVGAIPLEHPRLVNPVKCISCMQCVAVCPSEVRHVALPMTTMAGALLLKEGGLKPKKNEFFI